MNIRQNVTVLVLHYFARQVGLLHDFTKGRSECIPNLVNSLPRCGYPWGKEYLLSDFNNLPFDQIQRSVERNEESLVVENMEYINRNIPFALPNTQRFQ